MAVPGHDVAVLDAEGQEVAPGQMGEICVKAPESGDVPALLEPAREDGGEIRGRLAADRGSGADGREGYVTYVSRDDDVITSAGYRIGPIRDRELPDRAIRMW